jgi:hypothetical protein
MQSRAQTSHPEKEDELGTRPSERTAGAVGAETEASIAAASVAVVEVELNFNAFADHVSPTQHAKRVATDFDPSIQDFADQALEVAALRAELKRLSRDCDALRKTVRLRESLVQTLREQLSSSQVAAPARVHAEEKHCITPEAPHRPAPVATSTDSMTLTASEHPLPSGQKAPVTLGPTAEHDGSCTVVLETSSPRDCAATITDMPQMVRDSGSLESTPGRKLIPERQDGQVIFLNRDIITIGRTRQNDICIPTHTVSRDHARLLVGASGATLFDMGSANGCFVNDEPIKRHKLRDGDRVRIGDRAYRFADHVHRTRTRAGS